MFEKPWPPVAIVNGRGPLRRSGRDLVFQTIMDHKRFRYETEKYFGICNLHGRGSSHRRNTLRI